VSSGQCLRNIGGDAIVIHFLHDGIELLLRELLTNDPLNKLPSVFHGLSNAWSLPDDDNVFFFERGMLEGLVLLENLYDLFHKICY
jgi:hypothetical protein